MSLGFQDDRLVIIIGRGHSGTRVISQLVQQAGVSMPGPQNGSNDYTPTPNGMYEAAEIAGEMVTHLGRGAQNYSRLVRSKIPASAISAIRRYVQPVFDQAGGGWVGWKLPETTLVYPWMVRLFPRARFVWWLRDPRDCILKSHGTDDLGEWGVSGCSCGTPMQLRARSWLYQEAIVRQTPKPRYLLRLTLEEWAADQPRVLRLLGGLIPGSTPSGIPIDATRTLVWRREGHEFDAETMRLIGPSLDRYGWARA